MEVVANIGTYAEWIAQVKHFVLHTTYDDVPFTEQEIDEALGDGWQDVFQRGETVDEAAIALCGFINAGRNLTARPRV